MPILHVRNVPSELYERLRRRAAEGRRSLSAEVIDLLQAGLDERPSPAELADYYRRLDDFRERTRGAWGAADAVADVRDDRSRH